MNDMADQNGRSFTKPFSASGLVLSSSATSRTDRAFAAISGCLLLLREGRMQVELGADLVRVLIDEMECLVHRTSTAEIHRVEEALGEGRSLEELVIRGSSDERRL